MPNNVLDAKLDAITEKFDELFAVVQELKQENLELNNQVGDLQEKVGELQTANENFKVENNVLKTQLNKLFSKTMLSTNMVAMSLVGFIMPRSQLRVLETIVSLMWRTHVTKWV